MSARQKISSGTPLLEWLAAGVGLAFLIVLLAVIGTEALRGGSHQPPAIEVQIGEITQAGSTYVVEFEAVNRSGGNAAALQIEGKLVDGADVAETSVATIDYISGHGRAEGGLVFSRDPRGLTVIARPVGYQVP